MVSTETQSILQRKAALGTKEHEARAMSVAKAMRLSIAKIGKELFEMPLSAIGAVTESCKEADLLKLVSDTALLCVLEGDNGNIGAALIGEDIVGGLIQQQTMGCIGPSTGSPRQMTNTDAAMCAPLLDSLFERVAPLLENEAEQQIVSGYRFGARLDNARALNMALERPEYFVVRLTLDLAEGKRQGELTLILPKGPPAKSIEAKDSQDEGVGEVPASKLSDLVMGLPAELTMVLCQIKLELAQVQQWSVGEVLRLPHDTFPETEIRTETGVTIGTGTLGQIKGVRALRLKRDPVHATQPRRREADLADLDLPEITALPTSGRGNSNPSTAANVDPSAMNSVSNLPEIGDPQILEGTSAGQVDTSDIQLPDLDLPVIDTALTEPSALPELDDFPDLADLAELTQAG